jgi:hypothetical protein
MKLTRIVVEAAPLVLWHTAAEPTPTAHRLSAQASTYWLIATILVNPFVHMLETGQTNGWFTAFNNINNICCRLCLPGSFMQRWGPKPGRE